MFIANYINNLDKVVLHVGLLEKERGHRHLDLLIPTVSADKCNSQVLTNSTHSTVNLIKVPK